MAIVFLLEPPLKLYESGPKALKGKDAPEVLLPTLSDKIFHWFPKREGCGTKFLGKLVSVLSISITHFIRRSSKYPKSQFCLMTINQKENKEEILNFLNRYDLKSLPVAMDLDGESSKAYQVKGIPQMVIINQEGKVERFGLGFPFLENVGCGNQRIAGSLDWGISFQVICLNNLRIWNINQSFNNSTNAERKTHDEGK